MTQKEYKDKLLELENKIKEQAKELEYERIKEYKYEQVLENYHSVNEELRNEKEYNKLNCLTIDRLQKTIEQYEKILDKFTINYN